MRREGHLRPTYRPCRVCRAWLGLSSVYAERLWRVSSTVFELGTRLMTDLLIRKIGHRVHALHTMGIFAHMCTVVCLLCVVEP